MLTGTLSRYFGMRFLAALLGTFIGVVGLAAMIDYVELMRDIVLLDRIPNPWLYLGTVIASLFIFRSAYRFYMRYKNVFVDII